MNKRFCPLTYRYKIKWRNLLAVHAVYGYWLTSVSIWLTSFVTSLFGTSFLALFSFIFNLWSRHDPTVRAAWSSSKPYPLQGVGSTTTRDKLIQRAFIPHEKCACLNVSIGNLTDDDYFAGEVMHFP